MFKQARLVFYCTKSVVISAHITKAFLQPVERKDLNVSTVDFPLVFCVN